MNELKKVIISGGGTGGHIFPAVSIANALRKRFPDIDILFVGAKGRMEMERVPKAGYPIVGLPVSGFDRKNLLRNFKVLLRLWKSIRQAKSVIKSFKPQVAVGVGGYASGPTLKAAQKKGIPTVLQEQNSYPGVTNKMLGKNARVICTAYEDAGRFFPEGKVVLTGNPVRAALLDVDLTQAEAKSKLGFDPTGPLVLVVGGSLGARTINRSMAAGLQQFVDNGIQLLWQTGKAYENEIPAALNGMPGSIKATPFIDDMGLAYPNVAEDHQRKNAQALVNHQAAEMVLDADAPARLTAEAIALVKQPQRLKAMSDAISAMALRDSADKIVDEILKAVAEA